MCEMRREASWKGGGGITGGKGWEGVGGGGRTGGKGGEGVQEGREGRWEYRREGRGWEYRREGGGGSERREGKGGGGSGWEWEEVGV